MSVKVGIIASSRGTAAPPVGLLLDAYPGAAAAYSLRKLRTAYTGNCIQVRRSSDGALLDIGFVNNVLDTTTLQTFIGIYNGLITIWYDQSGNGNNATPQNTNNAPVIIQAGVLYTDGGKVAIAGGAEHMNISSITANTSYAGYSVMSRTSATAIMTSFSSSFVPIISLAYSNGFLYNNNGVQDSSYSFTSTGRFIFTTLNISNAQSAYLNGELKTLTSTSFSGSNVFNRILGRGAAEPFQGKTQEHIFYNINQASNNIAINTNINSFYSIYAAAPVVSDADAQAFVDRVYAEGGTVTSTEANAVNSLTISLKANSIWTKMRVIYPMVGASSAACSQNLKSSSFTGTINGCTFSSNGVVYGNLGEIIVPLNLNTMNSINDISFGYYCRNDISSGGSFGWGTPSSNSPVIEFWIDYPDGNKYGYLFDNANDGGVAGNSSGLNSISRIASNIKYIQKNNTINTYTGSSSGTLSSRNFYFGRGGQGYEQGRQNAFGFIADGLTSTNLTDLYTAVQAFQTTLGRQV